MTRYFIGLAPFCVFEGIEQEKMILSEGRVINLGISYKVVAPEKVKVDHGSINSCYCIELKNYDGNLIENPTQDQLRKIWKNFAGNVTSVGGTNVSYYLSD